jgi:mono/diheme cytochrome c family protein
MTTLPALLVMTSALVAAAHPSVAASADDIRNGQALARQICADCHAVRPAEVQSPNRNAPSFEDIASVAGMTPVALKVALRSSHREMPNLILDDDDLDQIVAYILSLPGDR